MRLLRLVLPALALALVAGTPVAAAPASPRSDRDALTALADHVVEAGAPGVVLQLVQEGRLGLDDSVSRLLPDLGLDRRITVHHLLNQTSGFRTNTMIASPPYGYEYNRFHYFPPEQLVELALTNPEPRHRPGERFEYSNTNYVLAGLVVERVTHHPVQVELQRRIFGPLELRDTSFPAYNPVIFGRHLSGYLLAEGELPSDTTVYSMSWAWTAGAVVSTVKDETTFVRAVQRHAAVEAHAACDDHSGSGRHVRDGAVQATARLRPRRFRLGTQRDRLRLPQLGLQHC